jgi:hypothetical protein
MILLSLCLLFLTPPYSLHHPFIHPIYPVRIFSSVRSTTGLIVVGDIIPLKSASDKYKTDLHSLRYLRASHSLIGGLWIGEKAATIDGTPPSVDNDGTPLGDSIYSAFVLQEAARLVDSVQPGGNQKTALIMYNPFLF